MAAFYKARVSEFLNVDPAKLLLGLTTGTAGLGFNLRPDQHAAWLSQTVILRKALSELSVGEPDVAGWGLLLEYRIPGRSKRLDAVLLDGFGIIVVEFKIGADEFSSGARWQLREYCWDIRDFHRESENVPIAQILVATNAPSPCRTRSVGFEDEQRLLLPQLECNERTFAEALIEAHEQLRPLRVHKLDLERWDQSQAHTTSSIIDEAQRLFAAHSVREVRHAHADNTTDAQNFLFDIVRKSRVEGLRSICFVTGVPGAGKTLVGLEAAYSPDMVSAAGQPACFASGNRPLLNVLLAALTLDRSSGRRSKKKIGHGLSAPMQNVHEFAQRNFLDPAGRAPTECVVVFDEAQRVWTEAKVESGLEKKVFREHLTEEQAKQILNVPHSEPDILLHVMERCPKWCVIIALVGGGQEINDGEAGLGAWGVALARASQKWNVWVTPQAIEGDASVAGKTLFPDGTPTHLQVNKDERLHLSTGKRSPRAESYAQWVNFVLQGKSREAANLVPSLGRFPILLTRDLRVAKQLVRDYAGEPSQYGIVASSGAMRLRSVGLELKREFRDSLKYPDWFLQPTGDIRSSNQLEVAATEFECQGLELDWTVVCWGGDLIRHSTNSTWVTRSLQTPGGYSPRWREIQEPEDREFVVNKYRVVLTRARFGTIICVPLGNDQDSTVNANELDAIAAYLVECGATKV